jgi:type III secretory pathway component EscU
MVSVILQVVRSQIQQLGIIIALRSITVLQQKRLNNDIFNKPAAF